MDNRMERISEVTEPDNLDVLSEKNHEFRKIEVKVSKKTELPELPEIVYKPVVERSSTQAQRFYGVKHNVHKTKSEPNVLNGTPLGKVNANGARITLDATPRGKTVRHSTQSKQNTEYNGKAKTQTENKGKLAQIIPVPSEEKDSQLLFEKEENKFTVNPNGSNFNRNNHKGTRIKSKSLEDVSDGVDKSVQRTNTDTAFNSSYVKKFQKETSYRKHSLEKSSQPVFGLVLHYSMILLHL